MLKDMKNSVKRFWQEDPAEFTQRVINMTLGIGAAALLIVTSVNIVSQLGVFAV